MWGITAAFHYPINSENTNGTDFDRKMKAANQRKEIIQHAKLLSNEFSQAEGMVMFELKVSSTRILAY